MVVDKQGKRIIEANLNDEHRSVGTTGKDKRLLVSEERNAEVSMIIPCITCILYVTYMKIILLVMCFVSTNGERASPAQPGQISKHANIIS